MVSSAYRPRKVSAEYLAREDESMSSGRTDLPAGGPPLLMDQNCQCYVLAELRTMRPIRPLSELLSMFRFAQV